VQFDPLPLAALAALAPPAYWGTHWWVTRQGDKLPAVGKRPPVGPMSQHGLTSILALGTYGASSAQRLARDLERANCVGQVGGFLIMELNEERRRETFNQFPRAFTRVVWGGSPLAQSGLGNAPIDTVNSPKLRERWAYDLRTAVERFGTLVRRPGLLHAAMEPSTVICLASTGGHLLLAIEGAELLRTEFSGTDFYAATIWPEQAAQQRELVKALQLHAAKPVFRWWLITNNMLDRDKNDRAVALVFACLTQAHRILPRTEDAYNLLSTIYRPGDGHGVAVTRFWEQDVAVYPTPLPPRNYLVHRSDVVRAVMNGIDAIDEHDTTKTILLETPLIESRRYVIVNVALRQRYLADLQREIRGRLTDAGWFANDPYRTLIFSSLGEDLNSASTFITVSVMSLEMAQAGISGVIAMAPTEQAGSETAEFTPQISADEVFQDTMPIPTAHPGRNGAKPLDARPGAGHKSAASSATTERRDPVRLPSSRRRKKSTASAS